MSLPHIQQVEALAKGDITVFEMFFRTHYQPLCAYAYTFLEDKEEAEEIVQTTFLSLWEKRASLNIRTAIRPYLYAMVRNACLNVIKHNKVKQMHVVEETALSPQTHEGVADAVHASELEIHIQRAMNKLPEQCRLVFKLSRFEELKYAEIAEQLDISVKTVENHMGKALKIMRQELQDYLPLVIVLMNGLLF